jgi:3-methyladenine DNA glycosylase/8-oxoguanine DNA glycosylase
VRAMRTVRGPATLLVRARGGEIEAIAWGAGAEAALERAPEILGAGDSLEGFVPHHPVVAELHRRFAGLRMCRPGSVLDGLVVAVLEQKVAGREAVRSWGRLVRALGEPAPGPIAGLRVPPPGAALAATPYWRYHEFGVERRRADLLRLIGARAAWLEECAELSRAAAWTRLLSVPGIGRWTAAEVMLNALGDPDAVSVGDYNIPHHVAWVLAGERRATDERMLELLAPYAGHRGRVIRLLLMGGGGPERHAPRMALRDLSRL